MINFLFKKDRLYLLGLIFIISLAWMLKTLYFVHELELSPHKKFLLVSSIGFSLCIISILVSKLSKAKAFFVFTIYLLSTLLMYADVVYERYYDAILHIELMGQANQVGEVFGAVVSLLYKSDYIYWIDLPFIAFALVVFYKKSAGKKSTLEASMIFLVGAAFILLTAFLPLKTTFSDQYKVSLVGIYPAHLYDLYESVFPDATASASVNNQASLKKLRAYFKENQEFQKKSAYFGKYKGKNVVIIQAESLNNFPIGLKVNGQEITPNLNNLLKTSNYYPNTFLQIGRGNTSDAEFVTNNSIYPMAPKGIYKGFPGNDYLSLANVLNKAGYSTSASHGNAPEFWNRQQAYKKQGYQVFYHSNHPRIKKNQLIGLGISDESIFKQMVGIYKGEKQPFYNFTISLTNHRPFILPKKYQYLNLPKQFDNTPTGNYLQGVNYFDKSLGIFIKEMKKAKLWDNTIFAVYGDHYGPVPNDANEIKKLLKIDFNEKTRFKIPLIIHLPGQTKGEINKTVASQMDIYPTITTLLGIEQPLVQFGKPLTEKRDGFVGFAYETTRYTFYSEKYDYIASPDGKFESGKCIDNHTNKPVKVQACREGYNKLFKDIDISKYLLENNEITRVYGGY